MGVRAGKDGEVPPQRRRGDQAAHYPDQEGDEVRAGAGRGGQGELREDRQAGDQVRKGFPKCSIR